MIATGPDSQALGGEGEREKHMRVGAGVNVEGIGAGDRNRTYDLRVTSALLYRLSYTGIGITL